MMKRLTYNKDTDVFDVLVTLMIMMLRRRHLADDNNNGDDDDDGDKDDICDIAELDERKKKLLGVGHL